MTTKSNSKDSTSNLFNRYVWLVDIIHRQDNITFEEINEYWLKSSLNINGDDLPLRTFHNHRKAIEQMFDINIECDKRNGYKYYIENSDEIEIEGVKSWLLNSFSINNLINESQRIKDRILFEKIPSGQIHLTDIIEAMTKNSSIVISYQNFWRDTPYEVDIYPYCIKVFKQRWYLIAFNKSKERILTYALDRIKKVTITNSTFTFPNDFIANNYFEDSFGIIVDDNIKAEEVSLKINNDKAKYIRALPLHHSQTESIKAENYTVFTYYIRPTYDFLQEILSHGPNIEVLSPKWFREEISKTISIQHNTYID